MTGSRANKTKCKTLIVEDDPIAAGALAKLLTGNGHEVQTVGTVDDALCSFAWGPESIILDLILPDGNGVTVLRRARKTPTHTRVAIVTAVQDPFGIDQITDLEPDAIFEKPVDPDALLKWLEGRKTGRKKTSD
jgi:DNA-binding response OmpR family regulator